MCATKSAPTSRPSPPTTNQVPFYVTLPSPTIDWTVNDGVTEIPIEERDGQEVTHVAGLDATGNVTTVQIPPSGSPAANPAFDVTPARLVTGLVTERGVCPASRSGLLSLFSGACLEHQFPLSSSDCIHPPTFCMPESELTLRQQIIDTCLALEARGLNQGTSGNVSARIGEERFLLTPSSLSYDTMQPADLVEIDLATGHAAGTRRPSSEMPFHLAIHRARPDARVVVHTHSENATAVSCLRQDLPAVHYLIGLFGGPQIRCAPYATFGTEALSTNVLEALAHRRAALMANHGLVVVAAHVAASPRSHRRGRNAGPALSQNAGCRAASYFTRR